AARLGGLRAGPADDRGPEPARGYDPHADDDDDEEEVAGGIASVERPKIGFAQVGGMEALKEQIGLKIIHPLRHPEMYRAYGRPIGGGILMYGPPGCGKTHLARATAGEVDAAFISVGIHEVLDMWIGQSERNLAELFAQARRQAPCVLFFDEVDALASRRSDFRTSAGRPLINQFLSELDGIDGGNDGLLVLAATNAPWHLDPAFRRPGRFDRVLFVPPPDVPARAAILEILTQGKPAERLDHDKVARKTDGFSGADLKAVVDLAIERKLSDAIRTGRAVPITTDDLLKAVKEVRPSTREWFATARNYVMYANEGGLYDDVKPWLA
ncbi:MAG TPA: ATP-binding protein, partial [Longimicrobium sp.]|nr:ATP-binding protein [Longimicrobium sp.]